MNQYLKIFIGVGLALEFFPLPLASMDELPPERTLSRSLSLTQPLSPSSQKEAPDLPSFCLGEEWARYARAQGTGTYASCTPNLEATLGGILPLPIIHLILSLTSPPAAFVKDKIKSLPNVLQAFDLGSCKLSHSFAEQSPPSREPKVGPVISIGILDLSDAVLSPESLTYLISLLLPPQHINLAGSRDSCTPLVPLMGPNTQYLNCAGTNLDDQAMKTLGQHFHKQPPELFELYLHDNPYTQVGLQAVLNSKVLSRSKLVALTINGAGFTEQTLKPVVRILPKTLRFFGIVGASRQLLTSVRMWLPGMRDAERTPSPLTIVNELAGGISQNGEGLPSYLHLVQHQGKKKLMLKKKRKVDEEDEAPPKKRKQNHSQANGMTSGEKNKKPPKKHKPKASHKATKQEETPKKPSKRKHSENGKDERAATDKRPAKRGKHSHDKNPERTSSGGSSSSSRK